MKVYSQIETTINKWIIIIILLIIALFVSLWFNYLTISKETPIKEMVKEVPVIKEVIKEVPVIKEVIKEVPRSGDEVRAITKTINGVEKVVEISEPKEIWAEFDAYVELTEKQFEAMEKRNQEYINRIEKSDISDVENRMKTIIAQMEDNHKKEVEGLKWIISELIRVTDSLFENNGKMTDAYKNALRKLEEIKSKR